MSGTWQVCGGQLAERFFSQLSWALTFQRDLTVSSEQFVFGDRAHVTRIRPDERVSNSN